MDMGPELLNVTTLMERLLNDRDLVFKVSNLFIEDIQQKMDDLARAISSTDFDSVRRIAHSIKGAAANLSAGTLRDLAEAIEQAAKVEDLSQIQILYSQMKEIVEQTLVALAPLASGAYWQ